MSVTYTTKKVKQRVAVKAECDKCKWNITIDPDDGSLVDAKVFTYSLSWRNKAFPCGDMTATLCEDCITEVFSFGTFTPDPC